MTISTTALFLVLPIRASTVKSAPDPVPALDDAGGGDSSIHVTPDEVDMTSRGE